jgi:D-alanyl-D-alanine carboxypeptidase/D-alanyl-D-alanine-endopeptidase (penicillin-binding protein 4)
MHLRAECILDLFKEFDDKPVSLRIYSLKDKKDVLAFQSSRSLLPNSIVKMITSFIALNLLGKNFAFQTSLNVTGSQENNLLKGNLVILADGDPTLGSHYLKDHEDFFECIFNHLKQQNIKEIEGDIKIDSTVFDHEPTHASWLASDIANYYGCGVHGFNFMDNSFDITFKLGGYGTKADIETIYPYIPDLIIDNYVTTSEDGTGDQACIYHSSSKEHLLIQGKVGSKEKRISIKGAIAHPEKVCLFHLKDYLKKRNIKILQRIFKDSSLKKIGSLHSPPLQEILVCMNEKSINLYAEALFKKISQKATGVGSFIKSQEIYAQVFKQMGIQGASIVDGSGLSELNRFSSSAMVDFLLKALSAPDCDIFLDVLPKTSSKSTSNLKRWFFEKQYENRLTGKTGSSSKGKSVAGFLKDKQGDLYCFCAIENLQDHNLSCLFRKRLKEAFDLLILRGKV